MSALINLTDLSTIIEKDLPNSRIVFKHSTSLVEDSCSIIFDLSFNDCPNVQYICIPFISFTFKNCSLLKSNFNNNIMSAIDLNSYLDVTYLNVPLFFEDEVITSSNYNSFFETTIVQYTTPIRTDFVSVVLGSGVLKINVSIPGYTVVGYYNCATLTSTIFDTWSPDSSLLGSAHMEGVSLEAFEAMDAKYVHTSISSVNPAKYKAPIPIMHMTTRQIINLFTKNLSLVNKRQIWWSMLTQMNYQPDLSLFKHFNLTKFSAKEVRLITHYNFCSFKTKKASTFVHKDFQVTTTSKKLIAILLSREWTLIGNAHWDFSYSDLLTGLKDKMFSFIGSVLPPTALESAFKLAQEWLPVLGKLLALATDENLRKCSYTTLTLLFLDEIIKLFKYVGRALVQLKQFVVLCYELFNFVVQTRSFFYTFGGVVGMAHAESPMETFVSLVEKYASSFAAMFSGLDSISNWERWLSRLGKATMNIKAIGSAVNWVYVELRSLFYTYVLDQPVPAEYTQLELEIWIESAIGIINLVNGVKEKTAPLRPDHYAQCCTLKQTYMSFARKYPKLQRDQFQRLSMLIRELNEIIDKRTPPGCSYIPTRVVPFGLVLFGNSGIGKSTLIEVISREIAETLGLSDIDYNHLVFDRTASNVFYDGYGGQPITVLDDLFQSTTGEDAKREVDDILRIFNRRPYQLHMSAVEDKKHCFFTSPFVVATCGDHPANYTFTNAQGSYPILRRFDLMVEVLQNPNYDPKFIMSKYAFKIHDKVNPLSSNADGGVKAMNWETFALFLTKSIVHQKLTQTRLSEAISRVPPVIDATKVKLCEMSTEELDNVFSNLDFSCYLPQFTPVTFSKANPYAPTDVMEDFASVMSYDTSLFQPDAPYVNKEFYLAIKKLGDPQIKMTEKLREWIDECLEQDRIFTEKLERGEPSTMGPASLEKARIKQIDFEDGSSLLNPSIAFEDFCEKYEINFLDNDEEHTSMCPMTCYWFLYYFDNKPVGRCQMDGPRVRQTQKCVSEDEIEECELCENDSNDNIPGLWGSFNNTPVDDVEIPECLICEKFRNKKVGYLMGIYDSNIVKEFLELDLDDCGVKCVFKVTLGEANKLLQPDIDLKDNLRLLLEMSCCKITDCRCSYKKLNEVSSKTPATVRLYDPVTKTYAIRQVLFFSKDPYNSAVLNTSFAKTWCLLHNCPTRLNKRTYISKWVSESLFKTFPEAWWFCDNATEDPVPALISISSNIVGGLVGYYLVKTLLKSLAPSEPVEMKEIEPVPETNTVAEAHGKIKFRKKVNTLTKFDRNVKRNSADEWSGDYSDFEAWKEADTAFQKEFDSNYAYLASRDLVEDWLMSRPRYVRSGNAHADYTELSLNKNQIDKVTKILNNCFIFSNDEGGSVRALCVRGRCFLVVSHFFATITKGLWFSNSSTPDIRNYVPKNLLIATPLKNSNKENIDITMVAIVDDRVLKSANILHFFATYTDIESLPDTFRGSVIGYNKMAKQNLTARVAPFRKSGSVRYEFEYKDQSTIISIPSSYLYKMQCLPGECTNVDVTFLLVETPIIGLHTAGLGQDGVGTVVSRESVSDALEIVKSNCATCHMAFEEVPVALEPYTLYNVNNEYLSFEKPRFVMGSMIPIGRIDKKLGEYNINTIEKSDLHEWSGGVATTAPAILAGTVDVEGVKYTIKQAAVLKMAKVNVELDPRITCLATSSYTSKLKSQFSKGKAASIDMRVLTLDEVAFGVPELEINSTNSAAAQGGWLTYFDPGCIKAQEIDLTAKTISDKTRNQINNMISSLEKGDIPATLCIDHLKMERRSLAKIEAKKTRVFNVQEFTLNLIGMMYFGTFISKLRASRIFNESLVGIKYTSMEWEILARLLKTKQHFFDGDIENFDASQLSDLEWCILDVINEFYAENTKDDMVRLGLFSAIIQSWHCCGDYIYRVDHGNTSGNWMTTDFNSAYVSLAMRYIFCCVNATLHDPFGSQSISKFNNEVVLIVNGDDNILAVSDDAAKNFNPTNIKKCFQTIFKTNFTDAKKSEIVEWKPFEELSILKRTFYYDPCYHIHVAQLDLNVILEMLWWCKPSSEDYPMYVAQVASAVTFELCFHPQEVYDKYIKILSTKYYESSYGSFPYHEYNRNHVFFLLKEGKTASHELTSDYKSGENLTQSITFSSMLDHAAEENIGSAQTSGGDNGVIQRRMCASQNIGYAHGQLDSNGDEVREKLLSSVMNNTTYNKDLNSSSKKEDDIRTDEEIQLIPTVGTFSTSPFLVEDTIDVSSMQYLNRPAVEIGTLASNTAGGTDLFVFDFRYATTVTLWNEIFARYTFVKYDLEVEFKMSTPSSAQGSIILAAAPRYGTAVLGATNEVWNATVMSSLPHVILDMGSAYSVKMLVPYAGCTALMATSDFSEPIQTIFIRTLTRFRSDGQSASWECIIRLKNVSLTLPKAQMDTAHAAVGASSYSQYKSKRTVVRNRVPNEVVEPEVEKEAVAKASTVVEYAKTGVEVGSLIAQGFKFAAALATFVGLSKENNHAFPTPMIEHPTRFWGSMFGPDNSTVVSDHAFSNIDAGNGAFSIPNSVDHMSIETMSNHPTIFHVGLWNITDLAKVRLFTFPVTVGLCSSGVTTASTFLPTKMSNVAAMFLYWRCDLKFKIQFFKNKYFSGRVAIMYFPPYVGTPPTTINQDDLQNYVNVVCDMSSVTECEFMVPYNHIYPVASTVLTANGHLNAPYSTYAEENACGRIGIYVLEKLVTLSTITTAVDYVVYASAHNCAYSRHRSLTVLDTLPAPIGERKGSKPKPIEARDKKGVAHMDLIPAQNRDNINIMKESTGHVYLSLVELLKLKTTGTEGVLTAASLVFDPVDAWSLSGNVLNSIMKTFSFYRGGFRVALELVSLPALKTTEACFLTSGIYRTDLTSNTAISTATITYSTASSLIPVCVPTNHVIEVELPWSNNFLTLPTDYVASYYGTDRCERIIYRVGLDPATLVTSGSTCELRMFTSGADDLRLSHYSGAQLIQRIV